MCICSSSIAFAPVICEILKPHLGLQTRLWLDSGAADAEAAAEQASSAQAGADAGQQPSPASAAALPSGAAASDPAALRLKRVLFDLFSVPAKGSQATAEARPLLLHLSLGTSQAAGLAKGLAVVTSSTSNDVQVRE